MDDVDRAQVVNEDFQAFVLQQQQAGREPGNYTGSACLDCGDEIPTARRLAVPGCRRCINCQTLHEHWRI
ncbi:TraR/DksA C4-type zinc finger protein [Geobacter sp. SVR]|uniref:TraR/DksA C4-type zinc finger protein n=1 Tax=Geobacter sp. SVR TaxID=2495594 RepID=UPI00143EFA53|nr:TraR/DksA C4-type zinc finger protein [Geobacter sp. SVR]BCS55181.1 conjugal transfer protein TraR [Geobacter sp. SVR]GCF85362.1 conjugal transfer protein TraR [Geobacter sp. SVR]